MQWKKSFNSSSRRPASACFVEELEARQLMSAGHVAHPVDHVEHSAKHVAVLAVHAARGAHPKAVAAHPEAHVAHAVVRPARAAVQAAAASSAASQAVGAYASPYPDCLGTWSGTASASVGAPVYHFTANFTSEKGVSLTGTFNLGSLVGGNVLTTATIGQSPSFLVQVQGPTATASFVGALAANGKYIIGRWSALNDKGSWIVGSFTMTR